MMLQLPRNMRFLGVVSLFMVLAFGLSEAENKQKTLDELIKEELERVKIEQPDIKEQRSLDSKTIDQVVEEELAREKSETDNIRLEREYSDSSLTRDKKCQYCGKTGGAVYTRWGRSECPYGSEIVYRGVAGGAWWNYTGGGGNLICLSLIPDWGYYTDVSTRVGKVYGTEYERPVGFDLSNNGGKTLQDANVLCVVCRSLSKSSIVMIPGRKSCFSGWEPEYDGYLMTEAEHLRSQTDYVCVDKSPEAAAAGYRDEDGQVLYNVEGYCGSLPCPPYVHSRTLTCVVCGK